MGAKDSIAKVGEEPPGAGGLPEPAHRDDRSLVAALLQGGEPPLLATGAALVLSGLFALFLSATGHFLPHDVAHLGMDAADLCELNECRVVHFMFHDRAAFGGSLVAIGALYLWLVRFPLRDGEPWAWWTLLLSGGLGFGSFLAYLGYGYLDTWHGVATLALLPTFAAGMAASRRRLPAHPGIRTLLGKPALPVSLRTREGWGSLCLFGYALGLVFGGATILVVGMTSVFVPEDLEYMGLTVEDLRRANEALVPLIAHDRAGFGGGVATTGVATLLILARARPSRHLWEILLVSGVAGFGCGLGVHFLIGYTDLFHLAPAFAGSLVFACGLALVRPAWIGGGRRG